MRRAVMSDDVVRLVRAAQRMARLAQDIGERAQRDPDPPSLRGDGPVTHDVPAERLVHAAHDAMAAHRRQPDFGAPAIFRNPVWLLMLELFAARRTGAAVSVKAASLTLGSAASTANRTILDLERLGVIASLSDEKDARRRLLSLTADADAVLQRYLGQWIERREPALRLSMKLSQSNLDPQESDDTPAMHSQMDRSTSGIETILQ